MSKAEVSRAPAPAALSADRVADWLCRHPDFLTDRPELAAILTPPPVAGAGEKDGPVDFGRYLVQRLQRDLAAARPADVERLTRQLRAWQHSALTSLTGADYR